MTKEKKTCKKEVQRLKKLDLQLDKTAVSAQGSNTPNKKIAAASPEAQGSDRGPGRSAVLSRARRPDGDLRRSGVGLRRLFAPAKSASLEG